MRILVVGAGAIGGYFGGRLLEAGRDVTFLVRPRRAAELARTGLAIRSHLGDVILPAPPTVTADTLKDSYDLILLSCKAYDLANAAESLAPAVGEDSAILPLLNGMSHLDFLAERFGGSHVLGGQCLISAALDGDGRVLHLNETHLLSFGERDGAASARAKAIASAMSGARFEARLSGAILQEMWEKWVFIATGAGITCLMRAAIGDIAAAGAANLATELYEECCAIAGKQGFAPGASSVQRSRSMFTSPGSTLTASMLRDIERGAPIEADHVIGDLLRRGDGEADESPLLRIAYAHLKAYEARRTRETAVKKAA
jgi:2-dehydropantoate 2-reductase